MLLQPYAIFRAAHVHIGRRVVGVARFGDPDHASAALSDTFLYVLAARRRSIRVQRCSLTQTPLHPSHPPRACVLVVFLREPVPALSRPYAHRLNFHRSRVRTQDLRRSCGRSVDADTVSLFSFVRYGFLLYSNLDWLPVATDHSPFPPAPDPLPPVAASAHAAFESFPHAAPLYAC